MPETDLPEWADDDQQDGVDQIPQDEPDTSPDVDDTELDHVAATTVLDPDIESDQPDPEAAS